MSGIKDRGTRLNFSDVLLLFVENLLAFRVVLSYLGARDTVIHRFSDIFLFPFKPLIALTSFVSDSSILELLPAVLVIVLFFVHRFLDSYREGEVT